MSGPPNEQDILRIQPVPDHGHLSSTQRMNAEAGEMAAMLQHRASSKEPDILLVQPAPEHGYAFSIQQTNSEADGLAATPQQHTLPRGVLPTPISNTRKRLRSLEAVVAPSTPLQIPSNSRVMPPPPKRARRYSHSSLSKAGGITYIDREKSEKNWERTQINFASQYSSSPPPPLLRVLTNYQWTWMNKPL